MSAGSTLQRLVIGTRSSALATWQAEYVAGSLRQHYPGLRVVLKPYPTRPDKTADQPLAEVGGKGIFTTEIETALHGGEIDLAVHSLKDLPTQIDPAFLLGAIPPRLPAY